ncbi:helix-turn-helix domain-containing protein [Methylobacterium sp. J-092]|uniref:helix-turn-helix domain-containing protein n=1 Tax=Methylobacterium sp. J-092 TaxID=2836667 RepID=UPI001FB8D8FD|nr:helix-turn-helix domain-containing protein [Methylobacterium sp. J-092]MCJ2009580.1 helix-turn-helix domain-containing protein [Methylobacterium sp. J-092]
MYTMYEEVMVCPNVTYAVQRACPMNDQCAGPRRTYVSRAPVDWAAPDGEIEMAIGRVYTLAEVAETLGLSLRQVEHLVSDGALQAFNVGRGRQRRDLRVLEEGLQAFVDGRRVEPVRREPSRAGIKTTIEQYRSAAFGESCDRHKRQRRDV